MKDFYKNKLESVINDDGLKQIMNDCTRITKNTKTLIETNNLDCYVNHLDNCLVNTIKKFTFKKLTNEIYNKNKWFSNITIMKMAKNLNIKERLLKILFMHGKTIK